MDKKKKFIGEIDILRGLLCIMVILIHTTATPSLTLAPMSVSSWVFTILNLITKAAVPGFIFISGFTLSYGYRERDIVDLKAFYTKRLKSVCIPYFIYTLIYYTFFIVLYNYEISLKFFIDRLIKGNMVYHLYFIIIIIQFYVLYPIINKLYKKFNKEILVIISVIISLWCNKYLMDTYTFFGKYLVFFMMGSYLAFNYEKVTKFMENKIKRNVVLLIGIICTVYYIIDEYLLRHYGAGLNIIGTTWYYFCLGALPMYYILANMIYYSNMKNTKTLLNDIAKVSFSIYLIHPLLIMILERFINPNSITLRYSLIIAILLIIFIVYSKVIKRIKSNK